jgi:hypothetical protein
MSIELNPSVKTPDTTSVEATPTATPAAPETTTSRPEPPRSRRVRAADSFAGSSGESSRAPELGGPGGVAQPQHYIPLSPSIASPGDLTQASGTEDAPRCEAQLAGRPRARGGERVDPAAIVPPGQTVPGTPARELDAAGARREIDRFGLMGHGVESVSEAERRRFSGIENPVRVRWPLTVHVPGNPPRDVTIAYSTRSRDGTLTPSDQERTNIVDERLVAMLARTAEYGAERGVTRIFHAGTGEGFRTGGLDHASGMAIDITGFEVADPSTVGGHRIVDPYTHWRGGRSNYAGGGGLTSAEARRALRPTEQELACMTDDERLLRNFWGFFQGECINPPGERPEYRRGDLFTPSHNARHHNHFHVGLPLRR